MYLLFGLNIGCKSSSAMQKIWQTGKKKKVKFSGLVWDLLSKNTDKHFFLLITGTIKNPNFIL